MNPNYLGAIPIGNNIAEFAKKQNENANDKETSNNSSDKTNTNNTTGINTKQFGNNISQVTGDATKARNITVNIDSFNKGAVSVKGNSEQGMTLEEVESWFNEALLRVIRSMELS